MRRAMGEAQITSDELGVLAAAAVKRVRPGPLDRATSGDCYQAAYAEGLLARRSAERSASHLSNDILLKRMQQAIYRTIRRCGRDLREADVVTCA